MTTAPEKKENVLVPLGSIPDGRIFPFVSASAQIEAGRRERVH